MAANTGPIVVGVDGSPGSLRAARMAWEIARLTGRRCYPVYAVPEVPAATLVPDLWRGARSGYRVNDPTARRQVERALRRVVPRAIVTNLQAKPGSAPVVIAATARRLRASVIVVGATSGSRGRTAQYLVRRGTPAVLVVRAARPIHGILVAVDGSPASRAALRAAGEYARPWGARISAVHVVESVQFPVALPPRAHADEFMRRSRDALGRLLDRYAGISGAVRRGASAAAGIAAEAAKQKPDLVVVASRHRGRIGRLLLGSTTEQLLADLPTSLLVVRAH